MKDGFVGFFPFNLTNARGFMFIDQVKNLTPDHQLYSMLVKGNPFLHLLLSSDDFGITKESQTKIGEACDMSRQEVRTYLNTLKEAGVLETKKESKKINGNWVSIPQLQFSHNNDIFIDPDDAQNPRRYQKYGYPEDYQRDWDVYKGRDAQRIGNKSEAYPNWWMSVKEFGHETVTRGTRNYINDCESKDTWKKAARTFWCPETAIFMEEEYQGKTRNGQAALIDFLYSPHLKGLIEGGGRYTVVGDDYMIEALLILKGTEPSLGHILDKIKDDRFRDKFIESYDLALKKESPRKVLYAKRAPQIIWEI